MEKHDRFASDLEQCYVQGNQEIYRGQNISLTCHGDGYPYPQFKWYVQGGQLMMSSQIEIQGNKLDIFNATMDHGGKYKCVVYNEVGSVTCGDVVNVTGLYKFVLT